MVAGAGAISLGKELIKGKKPVVEREKNKELVSCVSKEEVFQKRVSVDYLDHPLLSRASEGRFHTGSAPTVYLGDTAETVLKETQGRGGYSGYATITVKAILQKVVDLTNPTTQKALGTDESGLAGDRWGPNQSLASQLRAGGYEAVWTFSHGNRPEGRCLVVFVENLFRGSLLETLAVTEK